MKYLYKIIRLSAWLLVLITLAVFISGFTPAKNFLFPKFLQFAYGRHLQFAIFIFLPVFYLHSLSGIFILIARHSWLNKKALKIIAVLAWTVLNAYFVYAYFVRVVPPPVSQNNQVLILNTAEVAKHNKISDCWMIIGGNVYNLTGYASSHPGGGNNITDYCGADGTRAFDTKNQGAPHSGYAESLLANYYLGKVGL